MSLSRESLTRVPKPLRCTSLHQTILADSPSAHASSLPCETPNNSILNDTNDGTGSAYSSSSDDASMDSEYFFADQKAESPGYLDMRRNSAVTEKRQRRASSGNHLKHKQRGLSLSYTSPKTTAHAINEVVTRRESSLDTLGVHKSPEAERASFLAELPDAIARARKVHYRRDALLPKTKSFNRVQLSLKEDSAPFESDLKKEATLASILKSKAMGSQAEDDIDQLDKAMGGAYARDKLVLAVAADPLKIPHPGKRQQMGQLSISPSFCDDTLFTMEDVNTSSPTNMDLGSKPPPHDVGNPSDVKARSSRTSRPNKRKNEDSRYEPYITLNKRRAVSPSPASPLGSPNVKGSIFRIENLTL